MFPYSFITNQITFKSAFEKWWPDLKVSFVLRQNSAPCDEAWETFLSHQSYVGKTLNSDYWYDYFPALVTSAGEQNLCQISTNFRTNAKLVTFWCKMGLKAFRKSQLWYSGPCNLRPRLTIPSILRPLISDTTLIFLVLISLHFKTTSNLRPYLSGWWDGLKMQGPLYSAKLTLENLV